MLNDAYRTLKDPIKRTEYLLQLEGVELEEQSKAATEKARATGELKKQIVPPDLLEEVFELNMQLEELRMQQETRRRRSRALSKKSAKPEARLEAKHEALLRELQAGWKDWDGMIQREQNGQPVRTKSAARSATKWWTYSTAATTSATWCGT